jgi:tetratricopeptide (TPR) repeat protein
MTFKTAALAALSLGLAAPAVAQPAAAPPAAAVARAPLTAEQWREDLRFMAAEMERRHRNLYHSVSRQTFAAAVADLHARIPSLQRHEIIVGMMRIAAMVGDGHTNVSPLKDSSFGFRSLPLRLYLFEEGLYVRAAAPEQAELVGARIEAIGGVPVAEALRRVAEISPRDNETTLRFYAPVFLNMPAILHALRMGDGIDAATLTLRKGSRRWTVAVPAAGVDPSWPADTDISLVTPPGWTDARTTPQLPLWLQAPLDLHRLIDLPERNTLYAQLNMVTNVPGETLEQFGRRIRERAQATNPRSIVLDLRLNRGGNGDLRFGFVRELIRAEDEDTKLFVLSGRGAFSATQFILDDLDRFSEALLMGEPASSKPNSFGDSFRVALPNSGLTVRVSILYWQNEQRNRPWTPIDAAVPLRFADYVAGRDAALEAAIGYRAAPALGERMTTAAREAGVAGVGAALDAYLAEESNRYRDIEADMFRGIQALNAARLGPESLELARLTAERFPASAEAHNLRALLAEALGERDLAMSAARRAIEIDPNQRSARSVLERLQAPRQ